MEPVSILSPLLALIAAPLLPGIINRVKAIFAGRKGQPLLQQYYILFKLLRKGAVYSTTTTWVFKAGPIVTLASLVLALIIVPFGALGAPISWNGDLLLFIYLLALARFFTVVAALDTGSAFEGMGASREVFFSALAEPVMLLGIFTFCKQAGVFSLSAVTGAVATMEVIPAILCGAGLFIVALAENARIPVDDPNTHLELTMIHEVMVLDHSGPDFALINYGAAIKLWIFSVFVTRMTMPWHVESVWLDAALTVAGMLMVTIGIGVVESTMARLRLFRVPQLLVAAFAFVLLGLFFGSGVIQ